MSLSNVHSLRLQRGNVGISLVVAILLLVVVRVAAKSSSPHDESFGWIVAAIASGPVLAFAYVLGRILSARGWIQVPAKIVSPDRSWTDQGVVKGVFGGSFDATGLQYRYVVDGKEIDNTRVTLVSFLESPWLGHGDIGRRVRDAYDSGKHIMVWVNPRNPSEAAIEKGISPASAVMLVGMTLVGAIVILAYIALRLTRPGQ
jgi:Protein of unknown function (DUF3592)